MIDKERTEISKLADKLNYIIFNMQEGNYTNEQEISNDLNKVLKRLHKMVD
jgi:hypothetical protein